MHAAGIHYCGAYRMAGSDEEQEDVSQKIQRFERKSKMGGKSKPTDRQIVVDANDNYTDNGKCGEREEDTGNLSVNQIMKPKAMPRSFSSDSNSNETKRTNPFDEISRDQNLKPCSGMDIPIVGSPENLRKVSKQFYPGRKASAPAVIVTSHESKHSFDPSWAEERASPTEAMKMSNSEESLQEQTVNTASSNPPVLGSPELRRKLCAQYMLPTQQPAPVLNVGGAKDWKEPSSKPTDNGEVNTSQVKPRDELKLSVNDPPVVGSPELRRKLSAQISTGRKLSAPLITVGLPKDGVGLSPTAVKLCEELAELNKEPVQTSLPRKNSAELEAEECKKTGEGDSGKDEIDLTKRPKSIVKRLASFRFMSSKREKKNQDVEETKSKSKDSEIDENTEEDEKEKKTGVSVSNASAETQANKDMVKELSSFKFKGSRSLERSATPKLASLSEAESVGGEDGQMSTTAARGMGAKDEPQAPSPFRPPLALPRQLPKMNVSAYDVIEVVKDKPMIVTEESSGSATWPPGKPLPEYATLSPPGEDDESLSDELSQDTQSDEEEPSNNAASNRSIPTGTPFGDHVYEDIQDVMARAQPIAYQVSTLHPGPRNPETVQPVLYDSPQVVTSGAKSTKPAVYDAPVPSSVSKFQKYFLLFGCVF